MAFLCNNLGWRCLFSKSLQFLMWLNILLILNIKCISAACNGLDVSVSTYPQGDINIAYPNNSLEIFCTAEGNFTYRDISFRLYSKEIPSSVVNETTIKLYIQQPQPQRYTYYCSNSKTGKHCLNRVLVDKPPWDIKDFNCISKNLESLNCSWTYPKTNTSITYTLTFFANKLPVQNCEVKRIDDTLYCVWNSNTQPRYRQQEPEYVFNLVSKNVFGVNTQNITINHFSIVKPDKPFNLTIIKIGKHSVRLFWQIPYNIADFLSNRIGIDHKIEYQIAKQSYFHQVDTTGFLPNKSNYTFTVTGLPYSHMQYEIRVKIKTTLANDNFWSDPAYIIFQTKSDTPKRSPDIAVGAFESSTFEKRRVKIYWKQLEEYEQNGAHFSYRVKVTQDGNASILYPDKSKDLSYVIINNASSNALHVEVKSENAVGVSENGSYLFVPADNSMLSGPMSVSEFAFENGTYEVSWKPMEKDIDNYTLFWCQYNYTRSCTGRMNFTTLTPNKNSHIIEFHDHKKYQFAIAANRGSQSSGMVWARCDMSRESVAMYSFPVTVEYDVPGKTHVKLYWKMECTFRKGIIIGYNISYCPVVGDTKICDINERNHSLYIHDPETYNINVTDLLPCRTYRFDLALNTTYGLKRTNKTAYVTTSADSPLNPVNVKISDITNDSLIVSWDPPVRKNGNIKRYIIYNEGVQKYQDSVYNLTEPDRRRFVKLNDLHGFTNYSLSIVACNTDPDDTLCSNRSLSDEVFVRTRIGPPSTLNAPKFSANSIFWSVPEFPEGTNYFYQVRRVREKSEDVYNTTDLTMDMTFCEDGNSIETYQVRAVNIDNDIHHGAFGESSYVSLPMNSHEGAKLQAGQWSEMSHYKCVTSDTFVMVILFIALFIIAAAIATGSLKLYKKYRKMEDIKPVLPNGLDLSEKELKFSYSGWNGSTDASKMSSSDEVLLLPNKTTSPISTIKQDVAGSNDRTDSTTLSQASLERPEGSLSDEASTSSMNLEIENLKNDVHDHEDFSISDSESAINVPTIIDEHGFRKSTNGYVQPATLPPKGYAQTSPISLDISKKLPEKLVPQPTTSTYVMAGLPSAPIFTTGVTISNIGYVCPEDLQKQNSINFTPLTSAPSKGVCSISLPSMPHKLPSKCDPESSYIQLQSLEPKVVKKPVITNSKPAVSSGYISPAEVVMNKHMNILAGNHLGDESVLLDPAMSPDAYCRFSWNADPSNDNLRAILAESNEANVPKNNNC